MRVVPPSVAAACCRVLTSSPPSLPPRCIEGYEWDKEAGECLAEIEEPEDSLDDDSDDDDDDSDALNNGCVQRRALARLPARREPRAVHARRCAPAPVCPTARRPLQ